MDLRKRTAQFGGERTEAVAAACPIAGLAGLLKRGGSGADALGTDGVGGALELVRGGRKRREIAVARGARAF